ncbi:MULTISPECIES: preprotein translocase subunit SecE [Mycobacterium]|uniref:Protein translocase subunit SecE n=1 Tax=Mycobacterium kiyosense TaxID=2871094 RepID=A0A9P3Q5T0_9MYCO|nr:MULTISPECIES: preprotein translocase subunit SecE [Mycobacterium]BDB40521.1 protein translocase subunit SecE [Mycobacterium kiyosense]BDE12338.1 protein translocase subunit SecE [Mycobacterium sp. 20KCMC460]GLB86054.1 protein translocase subunit SecE [Mycobacterium kiyosense]GLB88576.1 protein translocase subunit SecE [Mycobacterium kiyosense]GLB94795.1 protein translocase subunit SecE [Mycobacterium kiyosense]
MSDEGDVADDAASNGGETEDNGGRTAVVTKAVTRPQRPTGKRSRQRVEIDDESSSDEETSADAKAGKVSVTKDAKKDKKGAAKSSSAKAKSAGKDSKSKKAGSSGAVNPFVFVYNYLKQVVAEMRKVIWPNRKQMLTYTSVVLVFLAFMVALVGGADLGLSKLVLLVFG